MYRRKEGAMCTSAQSALTVVLKLAMWWSVVVILIVLSTVNLCSRVGLFSYLCGQSLELWQLLSWLQSGYHVLNFFHLVGVSSFYKTAQRIWLRISSIALEGKLKVLGFD